MEETFERPASLADARRAAAAGGRQGAGRRADAAGLDEAAAGKPEKLVDLGGIAELAGIRREGQSLVIGAMTRHADVAASKDVQSAIPALAELAGGIGDRQVRAMGTIGGSLANNDPAACYPAPCWRSSATIQTTKRKIAADDFFQGMFTTALEDGELITASASRSRSARPTSSSSSRPRASR